MRLHRRAFRSPVPAASPLLSRCSPRPLVFLVFTLLLALSAASSAQAGSYVMVSQQGGTATASGPPSKQYSSGGSQYGYGAGNGGGGSGASAVCSGTIVSIFQWQKSDDDDDAPSEVVVYETCTATYQGAAYMSTGTGSCDNGLGSQPYNLSSPIIVGSPPNTTNIGTQYSGICSGSRYKLQTGGDTVTVECTPNARIDVGNGSVGAEVGYTVGLIVPQIMIDGQPITASNRDCLPGELIKLTVSEADANSTYAWTAEGEKFSNYDTSKPSNQLEETLVTNQSAFNFRWKEGDNGTKKKVSCTIKVHGLSIEAQNHLKVFHPASSFKLTTGYVYNNALSVSLSGVYPREYGMDWYQTVVAGSGVVSGKFGFIQLGTVSRTGYYQGEAYKLPARYSSGRDGGAPYGGYEADTGTIVGVSAGGAGDNPNDNFQGSIIASGTTVPITVQFERLVLSESYQTWLMFRSTRRSGCYVPLKKGTWSWSADVTPSTPPTSPPSSGNTALGEKTTEFPQWSSLINPQQPYEK